MAFLAGNGVPDDLFGADGDNYLNLLSGAVSLKTAGEWAPTFSATSGNYYRAGAGVPDNAFGNDGDYFLNRRNSDLYEKVAGVWVLRWRKSALTAYYSGSGAPTIPAGNGDHYLNVTTGEVYQYQNGAWVLIYTPGVGGTGVTKIDITTSASTYNYDLDSRWLVGWEVKGDSAQSPKLGTTASGEEMGYADLLADEVWKGQGNMTETFSPVTIYFSGLVGNNEIRLWLLG